MKLNNAGTCATVLLAVSLGLCACTQQGSGAATASDGATETVASEALQQENATEQNVRLIGRTITIDGTTWLPLSGSAMEFVVTGKNVQIELAGDDSVKGDERNRPRYAVLVNGEVFADDVLDEPSRLIEVPLGDTDTTSVVKVIHLSEALYGSIGVKSFTVQSAAGDPIAATDPKDLRIAFIGDSITCGYGDEAQSSDEPFTTAKENFMKSYAYLTAQALDADYETVCYSGHGIVSGWSSNGERNAEMVIPPLYDIVAKGYDQPWDFASHVNDVVVINLGTNDFSYTGTDEARMQEFEQAYEAFLAQVRERNPESLIVCTLGTMGADALYPFVRQAVSSHTASTGDARVMCYLSDPIDVRNDGMGTSGHPNAITQQKSADALVEVIRTGLAQ